MNAVEIWTRWAIDHKIPLNPGIPDPPVSIHAALTSRLAAIAQRVPRAVLTEVTSVINALLIVPRPLSGETLPAQRALIAVVAAETRAAMPAQAGPAEVATVERIAAWASGLPARTSSTVRAEAEEWSAAASRMAQRAVDVPMYGLRELAGLANEVVLEPAREGVRDAASAIDEHLKKGQDQVNWLLWGVLGLGALALGSWTLVALSSGGQAFFTSAGFGYGSALASVGSGLGSGIAYAPRAIPHLASMIDVKSVAGLLL